MALVAGSPRALMSPATATCVVLIGLAGMMPTSTRFARLQQALALSAMLIGWLGISRHLFGGEPLFAYAALALPTSVCVLLRGTAVLAAQPEFGIVGCSPRTPPVER